MAGNKAKPTKEQYLEAVDTLAKWFPQDAATLKAHQDVIVHHVMFGSKPEKDSPLCMMAAKKPTPKVTAATELPSLTPCEEACAVVVVDVIFFCLGLVGLHVSNDERMTRAIIQELGPETLRGFSRAIHDFSTADGAYAKAKALFALMGGIYSAGGFRAAFKVIKDEMSWWEWTKTGVIAVAQIVAWFATDGIAFIAEAALSIMSAEQLIEDAVKAGKACAS